MKAALEALISELRLFLEQAGVDRLALQNLLERDGLSNRLARISFRVGNE